MTALTVLLAAYAIVATIFAVKMLLLNNRLAAAVTDSEMKVARLNNRLVAERLGNATQSMMMTSMMLGTMRSMTTLRKP